jgi:hypothetical protein
MAWSLLQVKSQMLQERCDLSLGPRPPPRELLGEARSGSAVPGDGGLFLFLTVAAGSGLCAASRAQ